MSYRRTTIDNLKYLDEVFHNIAHNIPHPNESNYEGQDDDTILKWECVDDRFSTCFGSTYEIPINDFPKRDGNVIITIFGDTWLHVEEVIYTDTWLVNHDANIPKVRIDRIPFKDSLPEVLQRVYPNGVINTIGNYSHTANIEIDLDDVLNYLQGLSNYPEYFIFNGVSKTWGSNGTAYTIQKLKDIDNFCQIHKIRACCVFTENRHIQGMLNKEWAEIFSTTTRMVKFSVLEWVTHHVKVIESNYNTRNNLTNLDGFFGTRDLTIDANALLSYMTTANLENNVECYTELVYTVIKRFVLEQLFILHRECFYVSFVYKSINGNTRGSTYDYYFGTPASSDNQYSFQKPYYNKIAEFEDREIKKRLVGDDRTSYNHISKYSDDGWNVFKSSGQFVAVCIHTDFTEHLWAWQQGQSSCYEEFLNLRDSPNDNTSVNPANLMKMRLYSVRNGGEAPSERGYVDPPIFPITGCPMFTISEGNRIMYRNGTNCECPIDIWITRDNNSASITLRLHTRGNTATSYTTPPDLYQSIEFGRMSLRETESYIYPLYCGGGSTGLANDIYVFTPVGTASATIRGKRRIQGNVYDLGMDNICLSNSNILHPTKFNGSTFSNFKVLTPEGIWRSIYAHEQTDTVVAYPSESQTPDYAVRLNQPSDNLGSNQDSAYPFLATNWNTVGNEYLLDRGIYCKEPVDLMPIKFLAKLDSIRVALKNNIGHGQYLCYGTIPNCWRSWDSELPSGEIVHEGKKYLVVPCGWDGRLWLYDYHLGIINNIWDDYDIVDEFEKYYYGQNTKIKDKLVIELGDADV